MYRILCQADPDDALVVYEDSGMIWLEVESDECCMVGLGPESAEELSAALVRGTDPFQVACAINPKDHLALSPTPAQSLCLSVKEEDVSRSVLFDPPRVAELTRVLSALKTEA